MLYSILINVMKSLAVPFCLARDMNYLFLQGIHAVYATIFLLVT